MSSTIYVIPSWLELSIHRLHSIYISVRSYPYVIQTDKLYEGCMGDIVSHVGSQREAREPRVEPYLREYTSIIHPKLQLIAF